MRSGTARSGTARSGTANAAGRLALLAGLAACALVLADRPAAAETAAPPALSDGAPRDSSLDLLDRHLRDRAGREPAAAPPLAAPPLAAPPEGRQDAPNPAEPPRARGLLEPRDEAVLSSEIAARIVRLPVREGRAFAAGDLLVEFDCAYFEAQRAAAVAAASGAGHTLQNARQLARLNSVGALEVAVAQADYERARAEQRLAEVVTGRCTIRAPWRGRLVEALVHEHESVPAGRELLRILNDESLEVTLIVPSVWLRWLRPDRRFRFEVDETGRSHDGRVTAIGARIDAASESLRVTGVLDPPPAGLIAGMSGTAVFAPPAME